MSVASQVRNDDDGENKPAAPVKTVEKTSTHTVKRNAEPTAPVKAGAPTSSNRRGPGGNEGAFRDRGAGHERNQGRSTEEVGRGGGRGGAGARAAASWGAQEGDAELKDEQAGESIAKSEQKEAAAEDATAEETVPEDKSVSFADYLAQQAEKKLALQDNDVKIRSANEGSKLDKKWAEAKPLEKTTEDYFAATGGKKQRERERKVKQTVDFDPRIVEPERPARGGPRGGDRGDRPSRGGPRGGGRGGDRGGRG
ncbi:plasminogen activator inhibitor 1 RNA-binding protein, partial [Geosmithia morbida]